MFLRTVIRQGNKIWQLTNVIKQYKEENQGLRNELDFKELEKDRLIRNIKTIIKVGSIKKEHYVDIIKKIEKELDNAGNID